MFFETNEKINASGPISSARAKKSKRAVQFRWHRRKIDGGRSNFIGDGIENGKKRLSGFYDPSSI